jgi:hypothetical protein
MPLTLNPLLQAHLDGELQTVCTLWTIERRDGVILRFTDHDKNITYQGNVFTAGVGYDRSAIEDKMDLSVDNMDVKGLFDEDMVKRDDLRGGLFDGARVVLNLVNYKDLSQGTLTRRTGWLGTAKQNYNGQFEVELRGLSQALSEGLTRTYTPGCPVDLGSTRCGVAVINPTELPRATRVARQQWFGEPLYPDYVWKVTTSGTLAEETDYDPSIYDVGDAGVTVTDGTAQLVSVLRFDRAFTVISGGDRKRFTIAVTEPRLSEFPDWFQGGALRFTSGANAAVAQGVKLASEASTGEVEIEVHLRMPFNVEPGDTGTILPGCNKTILNCGNKFGNVLNFQGFPYVPGENFMKTYPNSK